MTEQHEKRKEIVRRGDERVPPVYTNQTEVATSVWDFRYRFGLVVETTDEAVVVDPLVTVYMSPTHAKTFLRILSQKVAQYEEMHGAIPEAHGAVFTSAPASPSSQPQSQSEQ